MSTKKMIAVKKIMDLLQDNSFQKCRREWIDFESGLLRMSLRELNSVYVLILGCRNFKMPLTPVYKFPQLKQETELVMYYNQFVNTKPFVIIQKNGDRKVYSRDELKRLGKKFDDAAIKAIASDGKGIII